jgi:hypothetical protein
VLRCQATVSPWTSAIASVRLMVRPCCHARWATSSVRCARASATGSPSEPHLAAWRRSNRVVGYEEGSVGFWQHPHAGGNVYVEALPGVVVFALGGGPLFVSATTSALGRAGQHEAGLVSGFVYTYHELGAAICVAVAPPSPPRVSPAHPLSTASPTPSLCSPSSPPWPRCSRYASYRPERHR